MGKYKLLVLDIDGTLTRNDKTISEYTLSTLIEAQKRGLKIVLASGRPTYGIVPLAEQLELQKYEGYILSFNGGEIIDWKTREVMYSNVLDEEVKPYLYECSKSGDFTILSYKDEYIITEDTENKYVKHEAFLNKMPCKNVDNFLKEATHPLPKCLIVGDPEPLHELELRMKKELEGRMGVFRSEPFFLELVPNGIDKAKCLKVLIDEIGVSREEVIACGDGFNDISMIEFAGLGVAMSNAQQQVKDIADYVTVSNEEDGVAKVIEQFFFEN